jgi:hypothetical protein
VFISVMPLADSTSKCNGDAGHRMGEMKYISLLFDRQVRSTKKCAYTHLTQGEWYQIQALFAEGFGPTAIGKRIQREKSTISRELNRNQSEQGYRAAFAQNCYQLRLQTKGVERQPWRRVWNE